MAEPTEGLGTIDQHVLLAIMRLLVRAPRLRLAAALLRRRFYERPLQHRVARVAATRARATRLPA